MILPAEAIDIADYPSVPVLVLVPASMTDPIYIWRILSPRLGKVYTFKGVEICIVGQDVCEHVVVDAVVVASNILCEHAGIGTEFRCE